MFDFLTGIVLLLSGIYEGYRLVHAVNALSIYNTALEEISPDTAAFVQMQQMQSESMIEIIVCGILLLLTMICLIRFIRYAIIGNLIYLTHNTTKDFLKTTNGTNRSNGGMKFTNFDQNDHKD